MTPEPWFQRWFGEEYLRLYPHRDREEAREAVGLLVDRLAEEGVELGSPAPSGGPEMLDLACGAGRHLEALHDLGVTAVGLDLSMHLLRNARETVPSTPVLRGDMRHLPFPDGSFRVVSSFFTSFGYFETEREDRQVLREIVRVLRSGGHVMLDFLNAPMVRSELTPRDVQTIGDREVVQERRLVDGGRRVEKAIRITHSDGLPAREFTERVRLYEAPELDRLLREEGLEPLELLGDYAGGPHRPDSPRAILFARLP